MMDFPVLLKEWPYGSPGSPRVRSSTSWKTGTRASRSASWCASTASTAQRISTATWKYAGATVADLKPLKELGRERQPNRTPLIAQRDRRKWSIPTS